MLKLTVNKVVFYMMLLVIEVMSKDTCENCLTCMSGLQVNIHGDGGKDGDYTQAVYVCQKELDTCHNLRAKRHLQLIYYAPSMFLFV